MCHVSFDVQLFHLLIKTNVVVQVAALSMEVTTLLDLPVKPKEVILKVTSPGA